MKSASNLYIRILTNKIKKLTVLKNQEHYTLSFKLGETVTEHAVILACTMKAVANSVML